MTDEELEEFERSVRQKKLEKENAEIESELAEIKSKAEFIPIEKKSIDEVTLSDVKISLDGNKSVTDQAEDVVGAMAISAAINSDPVKTGLRDKKAEELINKAETKATNAKEQAIKAETELQKAERDLYESVLTTFGIHKHLPRGLMKLMVYILSPIYITLSLLIGVPCGLINIIINNIDGIICRYEQTDNGVKPKIKTVFWVIIALLAVGSICLTVLACCHII